MHVEKYSRSVQEVYRSLNRRNDDGRGLEGFVQVSNGMSGLPDEPLATMGSRRCL